MAGACDAKGVWRRHKALTAAAEEEKVAGAGGRGSKVRKRCIDALLVLDRDVDLLTPLLTPGTFEGLLDEVRWWHAAAVGATGCGVDSGASVRRRFGSRTAQCMWINGRLRAFLRKKRCRGIGPIRQRVAGQRRRRATATATAERATRARAGRAQGRQERAKR